MKKNPQGKRWHRLDNTGKIFPMIANENLSNVFRISVTLKEEIDPGLLDRALEEVLPRFGGFKVKLKRGFFWYYFEENKRQPFVEQESSWPCRYIDPKSNQLYLFRVSYYGARINLEVFHAVTDGMGAVNFLKELTAGYLELKRGGRSRDVGAGGRRVRPDRGQLPEALPENADQTLQLPSCAAPYREIYTLWGTERGSRLRGHRGAEGSEP